LQDQGFAGDIDVRERVSLRNDDRRIDFRENNVVRHDVSAHAQLFAAERNLAGRRNAEALDREELEVRAVIAARQKTNRAATLGNPHRRVQLVDGACFAATHRVACEREQIGFQVFLRNAVDRIPDLRAADTSRGHDQYE
jgi:hypothetical protein